MEINEEWEIKLVEESRKIVNHGFGELKVIVVESREIKTKLIIWAGCSFVFFIRKIIDLDKKGIF